MKKLAFILLLFVLSVSVNAQFSHLGKIDTLANAVFVDKLDNIYLQTERDELLKYDSNANLKWRYSNNRYGKLHSVDVSDPLRILLFYADFQQVVVLNNNLNELTQYSFAKNGDWFVSGVAAANNNSLWVFERTSNSLIKLSSNFAEEVRSSSLFQIFDKVIDAKKLVATDEWVFLQQNNSNVLQFDRFGAFVKQLDLDSLNEFSLNNNNVLYLKDGALVKYNLTDLTVSKRKVPVFVAIKQVAVGNKLIAVLTEKAVFLLSNN